MIGLIGKQLLIGGVATTARMLLDKHLDYNSIESKFADAIWLSAIVYSGFTIAHILLEELTNKQ